MSTTKFIEATSADPLVRELHRKAVRLLNDSSLDRKGREFHMRRLQSSLLEHHAKLAAKAARLEVRKGINPVSQGAARSAKADPAQVLACRREFASGAGQAASEATAGSAAIAVGPKHGQVSGRNRPVLTLRKG
jgi:hypothetical protein